MSKQEETPLPEETSPELNPAAQGGPITPEELIKLLQEQLAEKEQETKDNWDRFLRERADLENYRKRVNREKEELLNYGCRALAEEILPVVDNLERALSHANDEGQSAMIDGIRMTHSMILTALKKFGVSPLDACGQPFDPAFHQAMSQVETQEYPSNTVVEEFQKGYMIRERLLRPAMVSVAK